MSENSKFSIGIDLGTTNTALAYLDHTKEEEKANTFQIQQFVGQNMVDTQSTLPSFLFQNSGYEGNQGSSDFAWSNNQYTIGTYARNLGEKTPLRMVGSAKSWLCAPDGQNHKVLPLMASEDVEKISPVEASAKYLQHLCKAWNVEHPEDSIEDQDVILTVPASFDVVARDLTLEAAKQAGLQNITLLEEPIAAFYSWIAESQKNWRDVVSPGDVVLVCDIGGGTTDFSLISVSEEDGNLALSRIAVGEHILLGGDNMDLALARVVQLKIEQTGKKIEQWQFLGLAHNCRRAKEQLLSNEDLEKVSIVIPSRGSRLLGKTLSSELTRQEVEETLLQGFFGDCEVEDRPHVARRMGLRTKGLNYATDSSILKYLAKFLSEGKKYIDAESTLAQEVEGKQFVHPTVILFNGGVTKSDHFQKQVVQTVNRWLEKDGGKEAKILDLVDPDLSVSLGASYYGSVRRGNGVRIKSSTLFPYYIGVESAMPAIPGMPPIFNALCVAPAGMEEGNSLSIPEAEFGLVTGETVDFRFFMSRDRIQDQLGEIVENAEEVLEELSPLEIHLPSQERESSDYNVIPVQLRGVLTEVGSFELWCDAIEGDQSWKLEFNLRDE
ncbi:MAG: hypothetical protein ACI86H_000382 [bacterium]|jgi:hypothetical protein